MQLNDSYETIYERALMLSAHREWEQAVEEYERILNRLGRLSPETRAKHEHLGKLLDSTCLRLITLLVQMGANDQIMEILGRLMDIAPDKQSVWRFEMAQCRIRKGEVDRGLAELQALADEEPDDLFIELSLGSACRNKESYGEAISHFSRAIELADEAEAKASGYQGLFSVYIATGQLEKATESWKSAVALGDSLGDAISQLYDAYLGNGDMPGARTLIVQDKNPLRRGLYAGMADYLDGDTEAAEQQWRKVIRREINEESECVESWVEAGLCLGETRLVIDTIFPFLSDGNVNFRSAVLLGIALAMQEETARADSYFYAVRQNFVWRIDGQLPAEYWELVDDLVPDKEVKTTLRHHFEGGEETEKTFSTEKVAEESISVEESQGTQTEDEE